MKTVIIPQKMSNTGSIHDIASENGDREIKFPKGAQYAIVFASYYGGRDYTTHRTAATAIKAYKAAKYSCTIVGVDGWDYRVDNSGSWDGELVRDENVRNPYVVIG